MLSSALKPIAKALLLSLLCLGGCNNEHSANAPAAPAPATTPEAAVTALLDWRIDSKIAGTPDAAQLDAITPYITKELRGLLQKARAEYENKRTKQGQEPSAHALSRERERGSRLQPYSRGELRQRMLGESDLFSSMFEGPTSFTMGDAESQGEEHIVPVRFMSARQLPAINWVDRVHVVREHGHYVVADVEYANHWHLGSNATLREALRGAAARPAKN